MTDLGVKRKNSNAGNFDANSYGLAAPISDAAFWERTRVDLLLGTDREIESTKAACCRYTFDVTSLTGDSHCSVALNVYLTACRSIFLSFRTALHSVILCANGKAKEHVRGLGAGLEKKRQEFSNREPSRVLLSFGLGESRESKWFAAHRAL